MGVDFTIVEGKGPKIINPVRSESDINLVRPLQDVAVQVPFLKPILNVNIQNYIFNLIIWPDRLLNRHCGKKRMEKQL